MLDEIQIESDVMPNDNTIIQNGINTVCNLRVGRSPDNIFIGYAMYFRCLCWYVSFGVNISIQTLDGDVIDNLNDSELDNSTIPEFQTGRLNVQNIKIMKR